MRFAFIDAEKARFPVTVMCRVLKVSRSGFYAWRRREPSARRRADEQLMALISEFHRRSRGCYGSVRVHRDIRDSGHKAGRHRVARLMRAQGLRGKRRRRYRCTTNSEHPYPVAANVLGRRFQPQAPDRVWVSDITYVWTREGWLYLCVVLDLYSRRVVGWSTGTTLKTNLVLRALDEALRQRRPGPGLLVHSDRGAQYASHAFRRRLATYALEPSMSRTGNCWDNAVAESFFATVKVELLQDVTFATRAQAHSALFDYIEVFYNRHRRHSTLGYVSPAHYEEAARPRGQAA